MIFDRAPASMLSRVLTFAFFCLAFTAQGRAAPQTVASSPLTKESANRDFAARPHRDFPNGVRELTNVIYSVVNGYRPLGADIFLPPSSKAVHPIVVYIHGGGWTLDPLGDEGITGTATMVALAARGYLVLRPAYRLSSEAKFPAQLVDVKQSIRWIKTYASVYGGDLNRVFVWGSSAGGNLAALVGVTCGVAKFDATPILPKFFGLSTPSIDPHMTSCVEAVVDWYGPIDFPTMDSQAPPGPFGPHNDPGSAESAYVGCALPQCPHDVVMAASPLTYIRGGEPPFLIMHGKADDGVAWRQSQELYDSLRAHNAPAQLVLVDGARHMFDGVPDSLKKRQSQLVFAFLDAQSGRR